MCPKFIGASCLPSVKRGISLCVEELKLNLKTCAVHSDDIAPKQSEVVGEKDLVPFPILGELDNNLDFRLERLAVYLSDKALAVVNVIVHFMKHFTVKTVDINLAEIFLRPSCLSCMRLSVYVLESGIITQTANELKPQLVKAIDEVVIGKECICNNQVRILLHLLGKCTQSKQIPVNLNLLTNSSLLAALAAMVSVFLW